ERRGWRAMPANLFLILLPLTSQARATSLAGDSMTATSVPANSATAALAAFASSLQFSDIPADVIAKAKQCLLDTTGCCIYGVTLPPLRKLIHMVVSEGAKPASSILGTTERVSPSQAALVNGT